jgi:predicted GIY-YIG superfamily endonuclease
MWGFLIMFVFINMNSKYILERRSWTPQEIESEANRYQTKDEFRKNSPAFYAAKNISKDFFDQVTSHMKVLSKRWSDEELEKEAKKYTTKALFMVGNPKAFGAAMRRGEEFWNRVTSHMPKIHKTWTDDLLQQEAQKYSTPGEFNKFSPSAYTLSRNRGKEFFDDITSHMDRIIPWTEEMIREEALKYKSRSEFAQESGGAYRAAQRLGILDDVVSHMELKGSKFTRAIYSYEFPDKSVYVGLTYDFDKRNRTHMTSESSSVFQHMMKTGYRPTLKKLTSFMDKEEASRMETKLAQKYKDEGWKLLNKAKTGALGGDTLLWTREQIQTEAQKYDTLKDFYENAASAIQAAKKIGDEFYQQIISGMKMGLKYWSDEELKKIAKQYKTRQEFVDNDPMAYQAAKRRGDEFYDSITKHMGYQRTQWTEDLLRKEAMKYKTKNQFAKLSPSAYVVSRNKGKVFFNDITKHMIGNISWTDESLMDEIKKYSTYSDFKKLSTPAYTALKRRKQLSLAKDYYNNIVK